MERMSPWAALLVSLQVCGCGRCGGEPRTLDVIPDDVEDAVVDCVDDEVVDPTLPKHDWNGITVMMRETEVREGLENLGFELTPSRTDTFPLLHPGETGLSLVPVQGFTPPIVAFDTERHESLVKSVYGLRFWFYRNRLFAFQPIYFTDPVDLVEPDDEAVSPQVMEERLRETFGPPSFVGEAMVTDARDGESTKERMMLWRDEDLVVLYRKPLDAALPGYDLVFFSPGGCGEVTEYVGKRLPGDMIGLPAQSSSETTDR